MKILLVNASDMQGGAARSAYRLHHALIDGGMDCRMLVQSKTSDESRILGPVSKIKKAIAKIRPTIDQLAVKMNGKGDGTLFSASWLGFSDAVRKINEIDPDVVHLHWINAGMMTIEDIARIKPPLIWTLHDNWAFSGGCHIKWECDEYRRSCGSCPKLDSGKENDLSRRIWLRKNRTYNRKNITIVSPSNWLCNCSMNSALLKNNKHLCIPNPIDTVKFKPFDKTKARELWNLPENKKLVLFGAMSATSDINKGFRQLCQALEELRGDDIELVVFGSSEPDDCQNFRFKAHYLGHLHDDVSLVSLYNAVDAMVVPSLQENLSNAIMESLACGTPVAAFDVGGNSDMIEHGKNGYLAKPFDASDLAKGIESIINAPNYEEMAGNARGKVVRDFSSKVVADRYISAYQEILSSQE